MIRLYIAGPMKGLPDKNVDAFYAAERRLVDTEAYLVRNPAILESVYPNQTYRFYLHRALQMLLEAEAVCILDGWQESIGASLEVQIARTLEMPVKHLDGWLAEAEAASA